MEYNYEVVADITAAFDGLDDNRDWNDELSTRKETENTKITERFPLNETEYYETN